MEKINLRQKDGFDMRIHQQLSSRLIEHIFYGWCIRKNWLTLHLRLRSSKTQLFNRLCFVVFLHPEVHIHQAFLFPTRKANGHLK